MFIHAGRALHRASWVVLFVTLLLIVGLSLSVQPVHAGNATMVLTADNCSIGSVQFKAGPEGDYHVTFEFIADGASDGSGPSFLTGFYAAGSTKSGTWIHSFASGVHAQVRYTVSGPSSFTATLSFDCVGGNAVNVHLTIDRPEVSVATPTNIFLSNVCEPFEGFSGDGWTTVDSDANSKPWGTMLYVAAGPDGPWTETGFLQPPYVISEAQMDALAALVGAADRDGVWMRAGTNGIAAMFGSMVQDREWNMDALCGTE